jgi:flavin-dependent dehydrogenase
MPQTVEFYFRRRLLPGYAWVFPLGGDRANVGVIVRADRFALESASLPELLDWFLGWPEMRERRATDMAVEDVATWQLPYAVTPARRRTFHGAILVGDAGGWVDPLTGEGIHNAVVSGYHGGTVAADALRSGDVSARALAACDHRCRADLGPLLERSRRFHRLLDRWPAGLEALFVGAELAGPLFRRYINRVSTDFVAAPYRAATGSTSNRRRVRV